jgi:hypothetical protein
MPASYWVLLMNLLALLLPTLCALAVAVLIRFLLWGKSSKPWWTVVKREKSSRPGDKKTTHYLVESYNTPEYIRRSVTRLE